MFNEKIKQLEEAKNIAFTRMKQLRDKADEEKRKLTKEEKEQHSKWMNEYSEFLQDLDQEKEFQLAQARQTAEKGEKKIKEPESRSYKALPKEEKRRLTNEYIRKGFQGMSKDDRVLTSEKRAQSTTVTAGGYTIDTDVFPEIYESLKWYGPFLGFDGANLTGNACKLIQTSKGGSLYFPTVDDTANTGELLTEAGDASSGATDLTFARGQLDAYKYNGDLLKINYELLQDSDFDILGFVGDKLVERVGRKLNTDLTTADGSSKPVGVAGTAGASFGKVTANATAFTRNEVVALKHSVDWAYHRKPKTGFMFSQGILEDLSQLTTSTTDDRPLWTIGDMRSGEPDRLEGYQYWINNDMASTIAQNNKIMLFGDFSAFYVRVVGGLRVLTSKERYFENDQVAIVALLRADSVLIDTAAVKYMDIT